MPIKIPNDLPARATLEAEGVMVMREADAVRQDIRPLRIGLLNLMPNKIRTETQFARLIGATPLQVELTLVKMTNHIARNTPSDHIISFYRDWEDIRCGKVRRLHRHRRAGRDDAIRGGDLLGRTAPHLRLDADPCAQPSTSAGARRRRCITSTACRSTSSRRRRSASSPAPQPCAGLALSARLLRRFLDPGVALDGGAA